ncbi:c-type cytochrome [Inquilinus sp. OTU3971]|uniref:c-type cytochrome n=1 Tax=Inquilinus sp. OTU3971 TaxID=3043855 RepID=UPI00313F163C
MLKRIQAGLVLLAVAGSAAPDAAWAAGDSAAGRAKARQCTACHGLNGLARMPNVPNIAGESPIYLEKQLKAFRSGERTDPQMSVIAKPLSDQDIADLAAWYSGIRFSVTVPE